MHKQWGPLSCVLLLMLKIRALTHHIVCESNPSSSRHVWLSLPTEFGISGTARESIMCWTSLNSASNDLAWPTRGTGRVTTRCQKAQESHSPTHLHKGNLTGLFPASSFYLPHNALDKATGKPSHPPLQCPRGGSSPGGRALQSQAGCGRHLQVGEERFNSGT